MPRTAPIQRDSEDADILGASIFLGLESATGAPESENQLGGGFRPSGPRTEVFTPQRRLCPQLRSFRRGHRLTGVDPGCVKTGYGGVEARLYPTLENSDRNHINALVRSGFEQLTNASPTGLIFQRVHTAWTHSRPTSAR